ncbi:MAG: 3-hydroxyacyl-[acyl-carrier-protein] dehydratase FabZ [Elusimicrobia bacterium RIFCSPHIGHO2_02_FULL_57_9]|nr:MAG: 3-hydroxyacyl-[acyl-carrier-protein] dehydratase FabZ [Elusimicrobia bacterium RIFCSPHIGHO2_02_FULL_57_9]
MTAEISPVAPIAVRTLDSKAIRKAIPHRYPFLLVDKVEVIEEDKKAVGTKCLTINEEFFQGHFPDHPVMPGVLIIEALAQTACVMLLSKGSFEGKLALFMGIEEAKFRAPVLPGSVLKMHIEILRLGRAGKFKGEAYVDGKLAAEGLMTFAVVDKQP